MKKWYTIGKTKIDDTTILWFGKYKGSVAADVLNSHPMYLHCLLLKGYKSLFSRDFARLIKETAEEQMREYSFRCYSKEFNNGDYASGYDDDNFFDAEIFGVPNC